MSQPTGRLDGCRVDGSKTPASESASRVTTPGRMPARKRISVPSPEGSSSQSSKTFAFSANERREKLDGKPPLVAAGLTLPAYELSSVATPPDTGTAAFGPTNVAAGTTLSSVLIRTGTVLAASPPGPLKLCPCATEYGSDPGSTNATSPLRVSSVRSGLCAAAAASSPRASSSAGTWANAATAPTKPARCKNDRREMASPNANG